MIAHQIEGQVELETYSFKFYELLNDDPAFAAFFQDLMFSRYVRMSQVQPGAQV